MNQCNTCASSTDTKSCVHETAWPHSVFHTNDGRDNTWTPADTQVGSSAQYMVVQHLCTSRYTGRFTCRVHGGATPLHQQIHRSIHLHSTWWYSTHKVQLFISVLQWPPIQVEPMLSYKLPKSVELYSNTCKQIATSQKQQELEHWQSYRHRQVQIIIIIIIMKTYRAPLTGPQWRRTT